MISKFKNWIVENAAERLENEDWSAFFIRNVIASLDKTGVNYMNHASKPQIKNGTLEIEIQDTLLINDEYEKRKISPSNVMNWDSCLNQSKLYTIYSRGAVRTASASSDSYTMGIKGNGYDYDALAHWIINHYKYSSILTNKIKDTTPFMKPVNPYKLNLEKIKSFFTSETFKSISNEKEWAPRESEIALMAYIAFENNTQVKIFSNGRLFVSDGATIGLMIQNHNRWKVPKTSEPPVFSYDVTYFVCRFGTSSYEKNMKAALAGSYLETVFSILKKYVNTDFNDIKRIVSAKKFAQKHNL